MFINTTDGWKRGRDMASDKDLLDYYGWVVGKRDPRLNTDFVGEFMVCEPYEDSETPTQDGRNGPWCIVGNNLPLLIEEGAKALRSMIL